MTSQEINYQRIIESVKTHAPEGRNVEHDLKRVAEALARSYCQGGDEPYAIRRELATLLGFIRPAGLELNELLQAVQERELYVGALWAAAGEYLLWATDTAAQHRMALAMLAESRTDSAPGSPWYGDWANRVSEKIQSERPAPEVCDDDAELVRRAVKYVSADGEVPMPRWSYVGRLFGLGSGSARKLCRRVGENPDEVLPPRGGRAEDEEGDE
jgi:hypothetical protein